MRSKNLNKNAKNAKDAKARFLIEIASGMLKAIFIGIMVMPITIIMNTALEGKANQAMSIVSALDHLTHGAYLSLIALLSISGLFAIWLYSLGIETLNEING
ncbi:MAG: hypothetical protein ABW170_02765 [Candidatus Thiodiazotropha sp. L084R]